jgi:hypothetical protein
MKTLIIKDIPVAEELPTEVARTIVGGMMNLRDESPLPIDPDASGIAGGPLHPGDDSTSIWWPHGYAGQTY